MRAAYEDIATRKGARAFYAFRVSVPAFEFNWHYHPEYEITLITKGSGKRMVGDSYESFSQGDLVFVGSGLPHTWVSEKVHTRKERSEAVVIQFSEALLDDWLDYSEFTAIKRLLMQTNRGLVFTATPELFSLMTSLPDTDGAERIATLLLVLDKLAGKKPRYLSSVEYVPVKGTRNEYRINKVCLYIQQHFTKPMDLEKVASCIHLSPSAFCKFMKRASGKTFSDYVNDVRITQACKLLVETDKPVSAVAYACGFETLTYFNRVFRNKKKVTPAGYRKKFM